MGRPEIAKFQDVVKEFPSPNGPVRVLDGATLDVYEGEFLALVGPSGCGKSTLLNMLAGLVAPNSGSVTYHGRSVDSVNTQAGYATQESDLLPWLTLKQNVELGLEIKGFSPSERARLVQRFLRIAGLQEFANSYPFQLSGGMQKRGSIIRTLIYSPDMILMDEPFGSLDAHTKLLMHKELLQLWDETRKTIIFVTHDLAEAVALSDRVAIISKRPGRVKMIYEVPLPRPRNVFDVHSSSEFGIAYQTLWQSLREEFEEEHEVAGAKEVTR